ncbi:MAG: hypothetical protein ACOZQL_42730 [Myxococcota bacterium]
MKTGKDVRPQHYQFAHIALPQVMFGSVDENLGYLLKQPQQFIEHLWFFIGRKLTEGGEPTVEGPAPTVLRRPIGRGEMWIIELPRPEAMAEALFVGLVPLAAQGAPDQRLAYFTLEYSFDLETKEDYFILCSWTADGKHHNHGLKVTPTVEAFSRAVLDLFSPKN